LCTQSPSCAQCGGRQRRYLRAHQLSSQDPRPARQSYSARRKSDPSRAQ
jgi:hypothetical protein